MLYQTIKALPEVIEEKLTIWRKLPDLLLEVQKKFQSYEEKQKDFISVIEASLKLSLKEKESIKRNLLIVLNASVVLREVLGLLTEKENTKLGKDKSALQKIQLMLDDKLITSRPEYNNTFKRLYGIATVSELEKVQADLNDFFGGFFNNTMGGFLGMLDWITCNLFDVTNPASSLLDREPALDALYKYLKAIQLEVGEINKRIQIVSKDISAEIAELTKLLK
jgi:hypothetical protein